MPRRNDLRRILIIGSGPIIIGQACEFDYSGTQAAKALRADGYEVVLVNSNPATIMTDPELADKTYVEPLTEPYLEEIIRRERPDALLSTVGGQTGLNLSVALAESGVLEKYGVELIGAKIDAIKKAEDRLLFKDAMHKIGLETPQSQLVNSINGGLEFAARIGYPVIVRPSFTLGGTGGGIAYNNEELAEILERGLDLSPVHEVLIEESVLGWKEFELEVMRDLADNCIIICSIENFDPMGVHTGDSITVAPAQTLTDREYQMMRDGAIRCLREIGVDTGGSNVQFAINSQNGRMVIIEMNPRVSRSSALASKATGFPIAKIAAKLAVGYRLDEIGNDITRKTPACFEPTIDYVVAKIPKWAFEKFPGADPTLGTQMKSVGEVMAIGRTFKEALGKGMRSLETGRAFGSEKLDKNLITQKLITPTPDRLAYIRFAMTNGYSVADIHELTSIDAWFLEQLKEVVDFEAEVGQTALLAGGVPAIPKEMLRRAKRYGISDLQLAKAWNTDEISIRNRRKEDGVRAVFSRVDTCAAEFESFTPYLYSCYEASCEADPSDRKKVMILGSGPNRIGQGIEFDYCCCHASFALQEMGVESIMVNCNPETVSTDYDTSDRLYFEPLTLENVLNIYDTEKPEGVIVQFGGQTPLTLALPLKRLGVPIIGTDPVDIDLAEDRKLFGKLLEELGIPAPANGSATGVEEACEIARRIGYPVLVRPSYVLGGRAMVIAYDEETVRQYMREAVSFSQDRPVLIDRFLEDATEVDVDALADGEEVLIAGIMEHIEEAGVHSGDSSCVLPPQSLPEKTLRTIEGYTVRLAQALHVIGLMNVQYAIQNGTVYVLEVNPRASRTVPYVSKATGVALPKIAVGLMWGRKLREYGYGSGKLSVSQDFVKSPVFPFNKFPGVDPALGPEMRSTGEVMGVGINFGEAFLKAQISAGSPLPKSGTVFISVNDHHKAEAVEVAKRFVELGFQLVATRGTAAALRSAGLNCKTVFKVNEGRPNAVDLLKGGTVQLAIYTTTGAPAFFDEKAIRRSAVQYRVPCITTMSGARAAAEGVAALRRDPIRVWSLQEIHEAKKTVA
jgi:carbamoyl-phosphate synthase large subunit